MNGPAAIAREPGLALAPPEVRGIMRWSGGEVVLQLAVKVDPARRIKDVFDQEHWA